LQFSARCRKAPTTSAPVISIKLVSRAFAPVFSNDADHTLRIGMEGKTVNIGLLVYDNFPEKGGPVRDIYALPGPYNLTEAIPTPPSAQIKKVNSAAPLIAEIMSTRPLTLDFLNELTRQRRVEIGLGGMTSVLDEGQMSVLRSFAGSVNLPDQNAPIIDPEPEGSFADLPSLDLNTASLETTLAWIKKAVDISGQIDSPQGIASRFQITEVNGCVVTKSLGGRRAFRPYDFVGYSPNLEAITDLTDLNPDLLRLKEAATYIEIMFVTTSRPKAIVVRNREGGTGSIIHESRSTVASIILRKDGSAAPIRDALIHAIRLCQSKE